MNFRELEFSQNSLITEYRLLNTIHVSLRHFQFIPNTFQCFNKTFTDFLS